MVIATALFAVGCSGGDDSASEGTIAETPESEEAAIEENDPDDTEYAGTAMELLINTIKKANEKLGEENALPDLLIEAVTSDNSPAMLGILADDFTSYIEYAAVAVLETDDVAFQAAVLRCKNAGDTAMIETLIQENFDPGKWVYVFPDRALTSVARPYILLAVGSMAETDAVTAAFKEVVSGTPATTVFYDGETGA